MYDHNAVPCWLIFDDGYRGRYAATAQSKIPGRYPAEWFDRGYIKKAATIEDLAGMIGIDSSALVDTITRFNGNVKLGLDPDFGRGQSAFNRCFGDPAYKPNPALGPLDKPPYYATEIYPSDVGTCGGLVTNEYAQVVDDNYSPIPGLYATGNITATLMGRAYPGAGASIADTTVFGYIAARHAADRLTMSAAGTL
jgi:3-oxosteroid 1-dehydrogenase